jgi:dTDP-glucose pyrophosphorylase
VRYYAEREHAAEIFYAVQQRPRGLCDALFRAVPFVRDDEPVVIGLPDTIWFPENALATAVTRGPEIRLVLFPVDEPSAFDAVLCDESNRVERVIVKQPRPGTNWVWGAVCAGGRAFRALHRLWLARGCEDEFLGHLLNAYIAAGNSVYGAALGERYMDVGTLEGYHAAQDYLRARSRMKSNDPQQVNVA